MPVTTGQSIIAQHARRHQTGHQEVLPVGNVLQVEIPLTDDPVGRRLHSDAVPLEPLLVAGQEIALRHAEQESARRGVRAVMAVSHVVSHARRPLQGPVSIRIIAVRLRARGLQKMLDIPCRPHRAGPPYPFHGRLGPPQRQVLPTCACLSTGTRPRAKHRSSVGPAIAPAWEDPRPWGMAERPSPPDMSTA